MKPGKMGVFLFIVAAAVGAVNLAAFAAGVEVSVLSGIKEVGPGEFVTHVFSITNQESTSDTFALTYTAPSGWGLLGAPESLTLDAGEEGTIFLTITVPPGAAAGDYSVGLTAVSQSDSSVVASAIATVRVQPVNKVELIPPVGKSAPPGGKVVYSFTVVNRGNAQDTFKIEANSAQGFPVQLSDEEISLSPQEKREVTVTVSIPLDASPGRDPLTVRVASTLYPGVSDQAVWFTTVLPPPPQAVGGTLLDVLTGRTRLSLKYDLFDNDLDSDFYFSLAGGVYDGYFSSTLHLSPLFGPDPIEVSSFTMQYRKTPATYAIGDTSQRLTDLLSVYCRGGKIAIEADTYDIYLIGGGTESGETRFGGRISLGPDAANLGIDYMDDRDATNRSAAWSLTAAAEPLDGWKLRLEGALGLDGTLTSRAFYFRTQIDTTPYFLSGEAFSVGTYFPGNRSDQAGISVSQRLRTDDFSLGASFRHGWNNVVGDPLVQTTITDELGLNVEVIPIENGPRITATTEFTWDRAPDLTAENEVDRLVSIGISDRDAPFPYSFSGKVRDRVDNAAGTGYRTLTFDEGIGLSTDAFEIYLDLTQERAIDLNDGSTLSTTNDVSIDLDIENSPHSVNLSISNTEDDFDLSLSGDIEILDGLELRLGGRASWDRGDAAPPSFSWSVQIYWNFDLPVPFLVTKGRIEGRVFIDTDGDGSYDAGDRPVAGAIVTSDSAEVSTDASGHFRFPPVGPGRYTLKVSHLPADAAAADIPLQVDLQPGRTVWFDVPLTPVAHLSGKLFNDENKNGTLDPGEGGFGQVRITISGPDGTKETYTEVDGSFSFTGLVPGTYTLSVDDSTLPPRFEFTTDKEITIDVSPATSEQVMIGGYIKPKQVVITFQPPTADFTYSPDSPRAGEPVTFDASDAFDFDGEIVSYAWDFDGDGEPDATGVTVTHTFAQPGDYDVTLTVTDNDGNNDSLTDTVTVK